MDWTGSICCSFLEHFHNRGENTKFQVEASECSPMNLRGEQGGANDELTVLGEVGQELVRKLCLLL